MGQYNRFNSLFNIESIQRVSFFGGKLQSFNVLHVPYFARLYRFRYMI